MAGMKGPKISSEIGESGIALPERHSKSARLVFARLEKIFGRLIL